MREQGLKTGSVCAKNDSDANELKYLKALLTKEKKSYRIMLELNSLMVKNKL